MAYFERTREAAAADLQDQIAALSRQLAALQKSAKKRGFAAYDDGRDAAADIYSDAWDRFQDTLPILKKRASDAERAAREHPAAAVALVGLVVAGLALAFLPRK